MQLIWFLHCNSIACKTYETIYFTIEEKIVIGDYENFESQYYTQLLIYSLAA